MYKLDPIERLPDGTLFRLTPGQLRSVRGLTKRCCNFLDGDCLLLDGVCSQYISRSLLCRWFRRAAAKSAARASSPAPAGQNTALPAPRTSTVSRNQSPPVNGARA